MSDRYTLVDVDAVTHVAAITSYLLEDQLDAICQTTVPTIVLAPDSTLTIEEAVLAIVSISIEKRCAECWDRAIRLKHPKLPSR